jgi:putative toxin-antitoxin system antitoxin component (TIGR02293 family)
MSTKARSKKTAALASPAAGPKGGKTSGAGLVSSFLKNAAKPTTDVNGDWSSAQLIEVLEAGLPVSELTALQSSLEVSADKLAPMLGISKATFHRHKGAGSRLDPVVSDRVIRFARLLGKAVKVFGDLGDAKEWLNAPQFGLGGAVPLVYAKTEVGAREVENLLGRIEHGVYS